MSNAGRKWFVIVKPVHCPKCHRPLKPMNKIGFGMCERGIAQIRGEWVWRGCGRAYAIPESNMRVERDEQDDTAGQPGAR